MPPPHNVAVVANIAGTDDDAVYNNDDDKDGISLSLKKQWQCQHKDILSQIQWRYSSGCCFQTKENRKFNKKKNKPHRNEKTRFDIFCIK